jgi:hypothetical protein
MIFRNEIKDFIKNTLILTLFFTLTLHLSWGYILPYISKGVNASNEQKFPETNITYLGNIATAMSLNIGQKEKIKTGVSTLNTTTLSIAEVLSSPTEGQRKLIAGNMLALQTYVNLLQTDIVKMLDSATDRQIALDEHISILRDYGNKTNERIGVLNEQITELQAIIGKSTTDTTNAKNIMQSSFGNFDYTGVDDAIESYTKAKSQDNRARIYMVYLEQFRKSYTLLQTKNKTILDTLTTNRDALIKRATIVVPKSWSTLLHDLGVIETQAEYEAKKTLE